MLNTVIAYLVSRYPYAGIPIVELGQDTRNFRIDTFHSGSGAPPKPPSIPFVLLSLPLWLASVTALKAVVSRRSTRSTHLEAASTASKNQAEAAEMRRRDSYEKPQPE